MGSEFAFGVIRFHVGTIELNAIGSIVQVVLIGACVQGILQAVHFFEFIQKMGIFEQAGLLSLRESAQQAASQAVGLLFVSALHLHQVRDVINLGQISSVFGKTFFKILESSQSQIVVAHLFSENHARHKTGFGYQFHRCL